MPKSVALRPEPNEKVRVALIDADGFLFSVACSGETVAKGQGEIGEDLFFQTLTDEEAYEKALRAIEQVILAVKATEAYICLSWNEGNFRKGVLPDYKMNRKASRRPPLLKTLREMFQERRPYPVLAVKNLEADDVVGITAGTLRAAGKDPVMCSPDKDLNTIPGKLYACREGAVVIRVKEEEADRFHLYQTLAGDPTDGYTGCPKIGPVKAKAILDRCEAEGMTPGQRWKEIVKEFAARGFDEEFALRQARVARILRSTDWDAVKKEPILWNPPVD